MLVHDMDFQEIARQQMMEGSGKIAGTSGEPSGETSLARPFFQGDIISHRNPLCSSLHNGGARTNNGVGYVKI